MAMGDNTSQSWIEAYLDCLLTQRKFSPHTIAAYERDLTDLLGFAGESK